MSAAHKRDHAHTVDQVFEFMRRHGLLLEDLVEVGGEDLRSSNSRRAEKARRVEKCWALMARLGLKFSDLPDRGGQSPDKSAPRRRGKRAFKQPVDIAHVSPFAPSYGKCSKINELGISARVGDPELNFGDIERGGPVAPATAAP
jgi:hypothetical protein